MSSLTAKLGLVKPDPTDNVDVTAHISNSFQKIDDNIAPVGSLFMWPVAAAPTKFLLCDGSAVNRVTYAVLFTLIGVTYGPGDGVTTFNLPNLKGKFPVGFDAAETEFDAIGEAGGEKTHLLIVGEMPSHQHLMNDTMLFSNGAGSGTPNPVDSVRAGDNSGRWPAQLPSAPSTSLVGGGLPHNNLPPYIAVNFIIKALY